MSRPTPPNLYAVSKYIQTSRPRWGHACRRRDSLKPLGAPQGRLPRGSGFGPHVFLHRSHGYLSASNLCDDLLIVTNVGGSNEYSLRSIPFLKPAVACAGSSVVLGRTPAGF